jgi:two-component system cell cycle response regulator DivK
MKVLIVEDNASNMKFVSDLLQIAGCDVVETMEAPRGIEIARAQQPDVILMDLQLPGMDGLTAIGILKSDESTREIKTIAMTAFAMKGDRERILAAGFDDYIAKPIRYKELLKMLKDLAAGVV